MMAGKAKFVVFNGRANRYVDEPLEVRPGELIRLYVVNAGPNHFSAFHVIGAVFDHVYPSGNPKNAQYGIQTYTIPPGGAAIFDLIIPEEGLYPMVTHSLSDALTGGLGLIKVSKDAFQKVAERNLNEASGMEMSAQDEAQITSIHYADETIGSEACAWIMHGSAPHCEDMLPAGIADSQ